MVCIMLCKGWMLWIVQGIQVFGVKVLITKLAAVHFPHWVGVALFYFCPIVIYSVCFSNHVLLF